MQIEPVIYIAGIDTEIGKTYATAFLMHYLRQQGRKVISQKLVQTGGEGIAPDIQKHRELIGMNLLPEDIEGQTCAYLFPYPASPHLSAQLAGKEIDPDAITQATQRLIALGYETVLVECAGGLAVPLTPNLLTIDYIAQQKAPTALVTNGRLGSINHTLLSLEALHHRNIPIPLILYNGYPHSDSLIEQESRTFLQQYVSRHYPQTSFLDVPLLSPQESFFSPSQCHE